MLPRGTQETDDIPAPGASLQLGLEAVFDQLIDAVVLFDSRGRVLRVNQSFLSWSGLTELEALETPIWRLPGRPLQARDLAWARARLGSGLSWQREVPVWCPAELSVEPRYMLITVSRVQDPLGDVVQFVAIGRDATQQRRLRHIAEELSYQDQLGYAFSGLRHELGNPINSMKWALTYLNDGFESLPVDKVRSYLDAVLREVDRVEGLLESIKGYGQVEEAQMESLELSAFFDQFMALVEPGLKQRGIAVSLEGVSAIDRVLVAPQLLQQILLNLVANASEAALASQRPTVEIGVQRVGTRVRIVVTDNGPEASSGGTDRFFEPFYSTKSGGTGLGLPISRRLAAQLRGSLTLNRAKGRTHAILTLDQEPPGRG